MADEQLLTSFEASKILAMHWAKFEPKVVRRIYKMGDSSGVTVDPADPQYLRMRDESGMDVRVRRGTISENTPVDTNIAVGEVTGYTDKYNQAYEVAAYTIPGYAGETYVAAWVGASLIGFGDPTNGNLKGDSHLRYDSANQVVELYSDSGSIFHLFSYGARNSFTSTMANGTQAAPTKTLSGDEMRRDSVFGWEEVTPGETNNSVTRIRTFATENFTATATGARFQFETTPKGTNSPAPAIGLEDDQRLKTYAGKIVKRRAVADTATTVTAADYIVSYTSLSAARIVTLTASATLGDGSEFYIKDQSGSCSVVNTLTITPAGGESIDGGATLVINTARGKAHIYTDGANWFSL